MRGKSKFYIHFMILMSLFYVYGMAQECTIVETYENDNYLVEIQGKMYIALSEDQQKAILKTKQELLSARKEIEAQDSLLAAFKKIKIKVDSVQRRQKIYINEVENTLVGYKELLEDCKKLKGEAWLTFEGGIGATRDFKPAIMFGLGIRRFRIYGLLQEKNAGVLTGFVFPIF